MRVLSDRNTEKNFFVCLELEILLVVLVSAGLILLQKFNSFLMYDRVCEEQGLYENQFFLCLFLDGSYSVLFLTNHFKQTKSTGTSVST